MNRKIFLLHERQAVAAVCFLLLILSFSPLFGQCLKNCPGKNLLVDPGFEQCAVTGKKFVPGNGRIKVDSNITSTGWQNCAYGFTVVDDVTHSGRRAITLSSPTLEKWSGARQIIYFEKPVTGMFRFGGFSKAENVSQGEDYNLYLDILYADGTALWGMKAVFSPGTHDWEFSDNYFKVDKPIKEIQVHVLLRKTTGKAWFDDLFLEEAAVKMGAFRVEGGLFGEGTAAVAGSIPWKKEGVQVRLRVQPENVPLENTASGTFIPMDSVITANAFIMPVDTKSNKGGGAICSLDLTDSTGKKVNQQVGKTSLSAVDAGRGFAIWAEDSTRRLFPHSLPNTPENPEVRKQMLEKPKVDIELARNEYESFQLAVLSPRDIKGITFECSPLTNVADSSQRIDATNIEWQQVGYIRADKIHSHPAEKEGVQGWWPDPLLPVKKGTVVKNMTCSFWFTVFAPKGTPPGEYRGTVQMKSENAVPVTVDVRVVVWNHTLDSEGHLPSAFALMDGFLEKVYGRPTDRKMRTAYGEFVLKHRLSPEGDISRTDLPKMDELDQYRGRGLGKFNVLNMVSERGKHPWVCNSPVETYTPEFKKAIFAKLKPVLEELRRKGLSKDAYIYTFDERGKEYHPIMTEYFGMIKEYFPEVTTLTTAYIGTDLDLLKKLNVDATCPISSRYHFEEAEKCRAAGKKVWSYICCGPGHPYANIMCRFPLIEARILGWQSYEQKYDGFLYWGLNVWSRKDNVPFDPDAGIFLTWSIESFIGHEIYGDGSLLYANKNGEPIGSIRLAVLRDGFEDYEYLYQLGQKKGGYDAVKKWITPVLESPVKFTRDAKILRAQRRAIAAELEK